MQERIFPPATSAEWVVFSGPGSDSSPVHPCSTDDEPELSEWVRHGLSSRQPSPQSEKSQATSLSAANLKHGQSDVFQETEALHVEQEHDWDAIAIIAPQVLEHKLNLGIEGRQNSSKLTSQDLSRIQKQLTISLKHHHSETLKKLPLESVIQAIAQAWYNCCS